LKVIEQKDKELAKQDELLAEVRKIADEAMLTMDGTGCAGDTMSDDSITLFDGLQEENLDLKEQNLDLEERQFATKSQLNRMSLSHEQAISSETRKAQLCVAAVSEIKPLNCFYNAMLQVLGVYVQLFGASSNDIPDLSLIDGMLDEAHEALEFYCEMNKVMRAGIKELEVLAKHAADSQTTLDAIRSGFVGFLGNLFYDPKMLMKMNGMPCVV
jgi:hypothetical protein